MLIDDGYILFLPGFYHDYTDRVILYPVDSLLALRQTTRPLTGHPSEDLPADDCLIVAADARRIERWTQRDRLVKARPQRAGGGVRLTYAEPREWRKWLTDDDWQWLKSVCDCAAVHTETVLAEMEAAKIAISGDLSTSDEPEATTGAKAGRATKKGRKAAKKMRRQQRQENL